MLAQIDPNQVPPWLSPILQGGSFALVVFIVSYLYPKLTREAREDQNRRDDSWRALVREIQVRFDDRNDKIANAFDKQTNSLSMSFSAAADRIEKAVVNVSKH